MGAETHLFCLVSFEGPDAYARAGGLADRVSGLAGGLAAWGYETHLFFFGDPRRPGVERVRNGHLTLHRWAQWLSAGCPGGVYQAEDARRREFATALPGHLLEQILRPMVRARFVPVVLGLEWQALDLLRPLEARLGSDGLRDSVILALELAAPSLGWIGWRELPEQLRILTRDPEVESAGTANGRAVARIGEGIGDLLAALRCGPGPRSSLDAALPPTRRARGSAGSRQVPR